MAYSSTSSYMVSPAAALFQMGKSSFPQQSPVVKLWKTNTTNAPNQTPVARIFNHLKNIQPPIVNSNQENAQNDAVTTVGKNARKPKVISNQETTENDAVETVEIESITEKRSGKKTSQAKLREQQNNKDDAPATRLQEKVCKDSAKSRSSTETVTMVTEQNSSLTESLENIVSEQIAHRRTSSSSLVKKSTVLKNWLIRPVPSGEVNAVYIQGDKVDGDELIGWHTSPITERVTTSIVATASGSHYHLYGKMDVREARNQSRLPMKILHAFSFGFPENWKDLLNESSKKHEKDSPPQPTKSILKTPVENRALPLPAQAINRDTASLLDCTLDTLPRTRSGRRVVPPLDFWRGERLSVSQSQDSDTTLVTGTPDYITAFKMDIMKTRQRKNQSLKRRAKAFKRPSLSEMRSKAKQEEEDKENNKTSKLSKAENNKTSKLSKAESKTAKIAKNLTKTSSPPARRTKSKERMQEKEKEVIDCDAVVKTRQGRPRKKNGSITNQVEKKKKTPKSETKSKGKSKDVISNGKANHKKCDKSVPIDVFDSDEEGEKQTIPKTKKRTSSTHSKTVPIDVFDSDEEEEKQTITKTKKRTSTHSKKGLNGNQPQTKTKKRSSKDVEDSDEEENQTITKTKKRTSSTHSKKGLNANQSQTKTNKKRSSKDVKKVLHLKEFTNTKTSEKTASKEWSKKEIASLHRAMRGIQPNAPEYWQHVSKFVVTRTEEECIEFHQQLMTNAAPKKKKETAKKKESVKCPSQITGGKNSLKRKRQLKELLEHHNQGYNDDFFESTPYRNSSSKSMNKVPRLSEDDSFGDMSLNAAMFETPANVRDAGRHMLPMSEMKTPSAAHSVFSPGFNEKNEGDLERYVHRLKEGNQRKAWRVNPSRSENEECRVVVKPPLHRKESIPVQPIAQLFSPKPACADDDEEEEEDYYFSDY